MQLNVAVLYLRSSFLIREPRLMRGMPSCSGGSSLLEGAGRHNTHNLLSDYPVTYGRRVDIHL